MKKHLELQNRQDQYEFEDDEDIEGDQQVDLREMERRFLSDRLTGPLTLLYVAQLCKLAKGASIGQKKELVIHIAGSNTVEMLGIIKWEYLAHRLPQLESMRLVFIGPELAEHEEEDSLVSAMASSDGNPLGICGNCADQGRAIHYEVIPGMLNSITINSYSIVNLHNQNSMRSSKIGCFFILGTKKIVP